MNQELKSLEVEKMSTENKLLTAFTTFMLEHGIECVEDIHQNDTVGEDSLELIEDLFNIIDIQIKCDNKQTNADRIRNMSDEELAEFIHKMEATCFADIIGYANKNCGQGTISCRECRAKAPTILEWLQSEAE